MAKELVSALGMQQNIGGVFYDSHSTINLTKMSWKDQAHRCETSLCS